MFAQFGNQVIVLLIGLVVLTSVPTQFAYAQTDSRCSQGGTYIAERPGNIGTGGLPIPAVCRVTSADGKWREYIASTGQTTAYGNNACAGLSGFFSQPFTCTGRMLSVIIGTVLITANAWLLATAGYLFNILIDHTVVRFGTILLDTGVRQAIDTGWTALRDLANIVIIAMFVFIAINIILGVKEYGEKRLIARVLIIAVLINFSLLFTKAIIDASNFTAYQFVKASGFVTDTADTQGAFENEFVKKGIAGEFIKFMGLASAGKTYQALSNAAFGSEGKQYTNANGWFALLHGLVSASLLFGAAAALLYGCYFLITRAVLLIFLMMTSALAFASWLIPQQRVVKGFAKWWEALLKAALFGPLLVIFLWASLNVARAISTTTEGKGTLGALISNPNEKLNLEALFAYVIVLGLLFASIYAANTLSKGIAGFSAAGKFWAVPALTAAAFGSRAVGLAGRGAIGAPAGWLARQIQDAGWTADGKGKTGLRAALGRAAWYPLSGLAKTPFDAMTYKPTRELVKGMGGFTFGSKLGEGGHWGAMERAAEELEKSSRAMAPSGAAREKLLKKEEGAIKKEGAAIDSSIAAAVAKRSDAQGRAEAAQGEGEERHAGGKEGKNKIEAEHDRANERVASSERELEAVRKQVAEDLAKAISGGASDAEQKALRDEQDVKIKTIRDRITGERAVLSEHKQALDAMREAGRRAAEGVTKPLDAEVTRLEKKRAVFDKDAKKRLEDRNFALQGAGIANSRAKGAWYTGRSKELQRQLGGAIEKYNLRKTLTAFGEQGKLPSTPVAPTPRAEPPTPPAPSSPPSAKK